MDGIGIWAALSLDGRPGVRVGPGELIGRLETARLRINDPRISEAHAMVSLRRGALVLLALRGRLMVDGRRVSEVVLSPGLPVSLGHERVLFVEGLSLPKTTLALQSVDFEHLVPPPVASLHAAPPHLSPGFTPEAEAWLWTHGGLFYIQRGATSPEPVALGAWFEVGAYRWTVVEIPIGARDISTTGSGSRQWSPLHIILRPGGVLIHSRGATVPLDGTSGAIVHTLGAAARQRSWLEVARPIWPHETDEGRLRVLWDGALARLRKRLQKGEIRQNLVRLDGVGNVELLLGPADRIERAR